MTDKRLTWRTVTDALAERMSHHAHCDHHPEVEADPDCPFCKDRAAYRLWERKSGQTFAPREVPGEVIDVFALMRRNQQPPPALGSSAERAQGAEPCRGCFACSTAPDCQTEREG